MTTIDAPAFGALLRTWRTSRRLSQLALAAEADVSQRHLSFLETGRAKPSREMVAHLGAVLDIPLRGRNDLMLAAGFAPMFRETPLDAAAMDQVRHVLEFILGAHDPYPAIVADRRWNVVMANAAAGMFISVLAGGDAPLTPHPNLAHLAFHPDGLRAATVNWEEAATALLRRLEREVAERPGDDALARLLEEVRAYPGVADLPTASGSPQGRDLLLPIHYRQGDVELRMFSTIATIGDAFDVTLEELRLETFFPADPESEATLRSLGGPQPDQ